MTAGDDPRSNRWTVLAVAVIAYAACDMNHEVVGHGLATALSPGVRALSLSTVGLQTDVSSAGVAAAGTIANLVAGGLALALFARGRGGGPARWFAWLFGTVNLLNGTGYPVFSGVLDFGDWAVVIAGREPHLAWRLGLVLIGVASYSGAVWLAARLLAAAVRAGDFDANDVQSLVLTSYVAGGVLLVAGSVPNPAGAQLILLSGASSGFGAMAGLTVVPRLLGPTGDRPAAPVLPFAPVWVGLGAAVALVFVAVFGPGVSFGS